MFTGSTSKHFRVPFFVLLILIFAALACGSEETATKIGEVDDSTAAETDDAGESSSDTSTANTESSEAEEVETTQGPTTYQVGDVVSIGDTVMVVLGWDSPPGDDFSKPDEGKIFVIVDLLFVNQSSETNSISSLLQMELKDDTGQKYDLDLMASVASNGSSPDGEISAGERIRGQVGFQVPEDVLGLVFVFDADVFGSGKVFVELGDEPIAIDPPTDLVGELEQSAFSIGDVIEIGEMTLTVNEITNPPGDEFSKPDEGHKFLVVDVTFENKSAETQTLSSLLQMNLKDDTGQQYDVDLMASIVSDGSTPDGEIAPGEKIRGQVGFQVPEDATGFVFVFDADIFGYGKVLVTLP